MKKIIILLIILILTLTGLHLYDTFIINNIINVEINKDKKIEITLENDKETECKINDKWIKSINNKCILDYKETDYIYLKNKYNRIKKIKIKKLIKLIDIKVKNKEIYLAVGGEERIEYTYELLGSTTEKIKYTSNNENIAKINKEGIIKGVNNGNVQITLEYLNKKETINVYVTDKINTLSDEFDYNKKYLECNIYTKEDNDLFDKILENRINKAGYKTRAGVVAAARFIALEFPYRINYFSENGRLHPYGAGAKIDGEGRYYHKGLYLDESRYDKLEEKMYGPGTWGCQIYSIPSEGMRRNGFDCSGFITWIIYNGGFECEDIGAGVSNIPDLTDHGDKLLLSNSIQNKTIKAGDLLSGDYASGGHIALVAGIKDNNYYVAESLWFGGLLNGAQIRKYTPSELMANFYWHVDMDKYYLEDGNYSDFWK